MNNHNAKLAAATSAELAGERAQALPSGDTVTVAAATLQDVIAEITATDGIAAFNESTQIALRPPKPPRDNSQTRNQEIASENKNTDATGRNKGKTDARPLEILLITPTGTITRADLPAGSQAGPRVPAAAIAGLAIYNRSDHAIEIAVRPPHRRHGLGRHLAQTAAVTWPNQPFWAHGNHPAAQALAHAVGWSASRDLWTMRRRVTPEDAATWHKQAVFPHNFWLSSLAEQQQAASADPLEQFLAVNARAFANHPEQGSLTRTQVTERLQTDWGNPAGLLLLYAQTALPNRSNSPVAASTPPQNPGHMNPRSAVANTNPATTRPAIPQLAGFHWTKYLANTQEGEVYVVGIGPSFQGLGLGVPLTAAGLAHLADQGARIIDLYVEGDNLPAIATYQKLGFQLSGQDVQYRLPTNRAAK